MMAVADIAGSASSACTVYGNRYVHLSDLSKFHSNWYALLLQLKINQVFSFF